MSKLFYLAVVILISIASYFTFKPKSMSVESYRIQNATFIESLNVDGKVQAKNRQTVYAFANGSIENLSIKLGDYVEKGQVVSVLRWDQTLKLKSPIAGIISKIYRDSAGPVNRGEPIFEVSDMASIEVVVELLTPDAMRLQKAGVAEISNWGGDGVLAAKIYQISRAAAVKVSSLGVEEERTEVRLSFVDIPTALKNRLGDNYHVRVNFLISEHKDVLTLPLGALFKNGDSWAVYVIENNHAKMKNIQISKRNEKQAMVTSGLQVSETVILFPGDKIRDGSLVKVVDGIASEQKTLSN